MWSGSMQEHTGLVKFRDSAITSGYILTFYIELQYNNYLNALWLMTQRRN